MSNPVNENVGEAIGSAIDERYSGLAESSCCLSCGGAIDKAEPQAGEVCLDLGSGRGQDVLRMAEAVGSTGFAYGIDTAAGMLSKARRTAAKMGVENVSFVEAMFDDLPLPDASVDLVISNCSINHASDKDAVWAEVYRVLKPNGRFVVSDIYSLVDVPAEHSESAEAVAECWAGAVRKDLYMNSLSGAGFRNIDILEESQPYKKGAIEVCSFTVAGRKIAKACCSTKKEA